MDLLWVMRIQVNLRFSFCSLLFQRWGFFSEIFPVLSVIMMNIINTVILFLHFTSNQTIQAIVKFNTVTRVFIL